MVLGSIALEQIILNTRLNLIRDIVTTSSIKFLRHKGSIYSIKMWKSWDFNPLNFPSFWTLELSAPT
jgi:hypothetical protein